MTLRTSSTTLIALMACIALPAWGEQYLLYSPQTITAEQKSTIQDGILVQEIEIKKGDTLYDLSHKFNGHGMYFSQILLFNSIKNPNLIYTGDKLRVPVSQINMHEPGRTGTKSSAPTNRSKAAMVKKNKTKPKAQPVVNPSTVPSAPSAELSLNELKTIETKKAVNKATKKSTRHTKKIKSVEVPAVPAVTTKPVSAQKTKSNVMPKGDGQELFESAVKAYHRDDCRGALELFERYLAKNPGSPLAADASLYKAECYLKLSEK